MPGKLVSRMSKRKCFTLTEVDTVKSASLNLHEKKVGSMPILDKNFDKEQIFKSENGKFKIIVPEWLQI